jgi:hypothetical protein
MRALSEKIRSMIAAVKPELEKISEKHAGKKPSPDSWSKKEIIGHLIDSASNNHQRFVRAAQNIATDFPAYDQNRWVEVQGYQEMNWSDLVEFFCQYNNHLCRVLDFFHQDVFSNLCNIGKEKPVTLEFVSKDYVRHLEHHLKQLKRPLASLPETSKGYPPE